MKRFIAVTYGAAFTLSCFAALHAQMTREQAVAGMRKVEAKEMDPTYTQAAPTAQRLVDEELAKHPQIILMGIHAQPPGHKNVIVASNFGRIGKIGDEDDLDVIHTGKPKLEVPPKADRFEVEFALKDKAGKTIGATGVVFNYKPGDDKVALKKIADEIAADMRSQLPDADSLCR
jgi:iron complex outermembrane receptor protein